VGALEPQFYAEFTRLLFLPGGVPADLPPQHDSSRWPELRARFAARFAQRSQEEWAKAFSGTDACVAPVRTMTEAPADPHLAARGTYVTVDGVVQPAPAPRFGDGTPGAVIGALPPGRIARTGAHTREVLTALGFTDADELLASGAVQQA
jgi:alpha-methylacyl-CoA racemase